MGIDMVTLDSHKISIMICTKLTKTDRTAINNSYKITQENSTNNNVNYCWKLLHEIRLKKTTNKVRRAEWEWKEVKRVRKKVPTA